MSQLALQDGEVLLPARLMYNARMTPKLTQEMRQALQEQPGKPVQVEDDQTHKVYVLVARDAFCQMVDEELRRQLQIGFDQADAGDVGEWNADEILAEARRRHAERHR